MQLEWKTFSTAKSGNQSEENEDACFPEDENNKEVKEFRCALSDGATSTSFSRKWANLLVKTCVLELESNQQNLKAVVKKGQIQWNKSISELDLPWHAVQKTQQGAFSTLLWFRIVQTGYSNKMLGNWQVAAVGDTCFFHIRANKIQASFPFQKSSEINNHPFLLSSIENKNEILWKNGLPQKGKGAFEGGDEFIFMTDALSYWFLSELEQGKSPMEEIRNMIFTGKSNSAKFDEWIVNLRGNNSLKNDDTTLAYLRIQKEEPLIQVKKWM